ncbi:MAG: RNA-binding protein [Nitrospirae bacterium GWD2_57_9]|nr:MAG: RNA-binding protein [Nitrospirae bacterium GWD2_57_9]OGW49160.1 MAG: RNA-binding protein [Nitrospirae bacterium GWC2_57_9]
MEEFNLKNSDFIELNNLLKVMGLCDTGGMAKVAIAEGEVQVDGKVELRKRAKIRAGQIVEMGGRKIMVR